MNDKNLPKNEFKTFKEFYPYYLSEHQNPVCKLMHFAGSALTLLVIFYIIASSNYRLIILLPIIGYGFAWLGHFFFEKNKPATFSYPFYSLAGDWVMFKDILIGKLKIYDSRT